MPDKMVGEIAIMNLTIMKAILEVMEVKIILAAATILGGN